MADSAKVLLVFAHPAFEKSRVNVAMVNAAQSVEGVTFHDLYEAYPDFGINIPVEQALLKEHDVIVLQHPLYWYSTPAIMKEWFDLVLEYGWAYGRDGDALTGKKLLTVTTTGGGAEAYCSHGHNRFTIREFLRPIEQTARLCGMKYPTPYVVHGSLHLDEKDRVTVAENYRQMLTRVARGEVDWDALDSDGEGLMATG